MDLGLWQRASQSGPAQDLFAVAGPLTEPADVVAADPLAADAVVADMPALDAVERRRVLLPWLAAVVEDSESWRLQFPDPAALAAMRDVGLMLGALQRDGVQPADIHRDLPRLLQQWGDAADMVPRDTVVHYGIWNPTGPRERRYTTDPQESALIDSVRRSARLLPDLALYLYLAHSHGLDSDQGAADLTGALECLRAYVGVFESVRDRVSPEFFAKDLRPFFDPLWVGGVEFHGPAAAFLPMYLVDVLLWGESGPQHHAMMSEAAEYGVPQWRTLLRICRTLPPLTTIFEDLVRVHGSDARSTYEGGVIDEMMRLLVAFRGRHATVARQAYAVTEYREGSGGYSPDLLVAITRATRDAECALRPSLGGSDA